MVQPLFTRRTAVVLVAACGVGFLGGAFLVAVSSAQVWFYVLGALLAAISVLQVLTPGGGLPLRRHRPATASGLGHDDRGEALDPEHEEASARVPDLMQALEASLAAVSDRPESRGEDLARAFEAAWTRIESHREMWGEGVALTRNEHAVLVVLTTYWTSVRDVARDLELDEDMTREILSRGMARLATDLMRARR